MTFVRVECLDHCIRRVRPIALIAAHVVLLSACSHADGVSVNEVVPGDALRLSVVRRDSVVVYRLTRQVDGSLEVVQDNVGYPQRFRLTDIRRMQVIRGKDYRQAAFTGGGLGSIGGLLLGMGCAAMADCRASIGVLSPVIGFGVGGAIGAVGGAYLAPPRWVDVRFR